MNFYPKFNFQQISREFHILCVLVILLTLMLLVANLAITKWCKQSQKLTEALAHGFSSESAQRELSNEY